MVSLSDELSAMLFQSVQSFLKVNRTVADSKPIHDFLATPDLLKRDSARALLETMQEDSSSVKVTLTDPFRRTLLFVGEPDPRYDSLFLHANRIDTGMVGKIYSFGNNIYYPVISGVIAEGKIIGYVVRWRKLSNTPQAVASLKQLMGVEAKLYFGNADQSLWTDMIHPVPAPVPSDARQVQSVYEYSNGSGDRFEAASKLIHLSPWMVTVEFSEKTILQPAQRSIRWVFIIGSVLILIGIFVAWQMSRNITGPLKKLTQAASAMANGNYSLRVDPNRRDEVGKLARAFNAMVIQVNRAKSDLEKKVLEAEQVNRQLRDLSAHLQNIREEERMHIAREMHDELGQFLTGLKMDIGWLKKRINDDKESAASKEKLIEMAALVDGAVLFVRKLAAELRPSILDDLGLVAALDWHSQEFTRRFHVEVDFRCEPGDLHVSSLVATGLFRMYQESLTNVARHAGAEKVIARLKLSNDQITLTVRDDGKGFDMKGSDKGKTLGLLGMKERALMIGGKLEIHSSPGKGTTIVIKVPLEMEAQAKTKS